VTALPVVSSLVAGARRGYRQHSGSAKIVLACLGSGLDPAKHPLGLFADVGQDPGGPDRTDAGQLQ
jgi:hypothetical protein